MDNDNEKQAKEAWDYFESLAEVNIKRLVILVEAINTELQHTQKEGTAWYVAFSLPQNIMSHRVAQNLIRQIGSRFRFWEPDDIYNQNNGHTNIHPKHKYDMVWLFLENKDNFLYFQRELKGFIEDQTDKVCFDEKAGLITFGKKKCKLTKYKGRFSFCKKMFGYPPGHEVSWDEIYEEVSGLEPDEFKTGTKTNKQIQRTILDTMIGINKQVKKYLGIEHLFREENSHYKRTI